MGVVKNLLVRVGADFSELQKEMAKAGKYMKTAGKELQNVGKGLTVGLTLPILGIGVAGLKTASDLKEVQNIVDTAFGKSSSTVDSWAKNALNAYGLTELQAKQFAGTMRAMTGSMGISSGVADKMSMSLAGLAGDMASFYNISQEEAFEKLRSGISGETEPLKQLGVNMSVVNLEAYALAKGLKKPYKEMTESEKAQLRYNYLMSVTKNAQGDFSKTSGSFANELRVVKGTFTDIAGELMAQFLPYLEKALGKVKEGLSWFRNLSDSQKNLAVKFAMVAAAIGPVIYILGMLTSTISSVLIWSAGISKAFAAVQAGTKGVGAILTAVFSPAGIVLLVIAGIAAIVAEIMYLWKTNENFRNAISKIWNDVKLAWSFVVDGFKGVGDPLALAGSIWLAFYQLGQKLGIIWAAIKATVINAWIYIKTTIIPILINIKNAIISAFQYAWITLQPVITGIKQLLNAAWQFILAAVKAFLTIFKAIWTVTFNFFKPIVVFAFNAIKNFFTTWGSNIITFFKITWDTVVGVFRGVVRIFTGIFQVFTGLLTGNWKKVWEGIKNIFLGIWDSLKSIFKGGINYFINGINSMINGVNKVKIPSWIPLIGGKGFSIPHIPLLAKGGIITKPTLSVIGEGNENEAVLPLSKLENLLKNNKDESKAERAQYINIDKFVVQDKGDQDRTLAQLQFLAAL